MESSRRGSNEPKSCLSEIVDVRFAVGHGHLRYNHGAPAGAANPAQGTKMKTIDTLRFFPLLMASFMIGPSAADADPGNPIAIRHLPGGGFAIESMWNLSVVISVDEYETGSNEGVDVVPAGMKAGEPGASGRIVLSSDEPTDHLLDRLPNEPNVSWRPFAEATKKSSNAIRVKTFGKSGVTLVEVDGVRIGHMHISKNQDPRPKDAVGAFVGSDVVLFTTSDSEEELIEEMEQRSGGERYGTVIVGTRSLDTVTGNTAITRAVDSKKGKDIRLVVLSRKPIELSGELAELMEKKEAACRASQKVFAALSVAQMNFRPANGSHTPRWNAEHMMGRELGFFSQIFAKQDPMVPVMNLNPKQMPPDYVARHDNWTGAEEAMQMERVSAFTRRFAYLLEGLPLDKKAPGSSWTPRALLRQMDRHYGEHTANVVKKFELAGWPQE